MKLSYRPTVTCVFRTLKFIGIVTSVWPILSKNKILRYLTRAVHFIVVLLYFIMVMCIVITAVFHTNKISDFTILMVEFLVVLEATFNLLYSKLRVGAYRSIIVQTIVYFKGLSHREKCLHDKYALSYLPLDIYVFLNYVVAITFFNVTPTFLKNQTLPLDVWYPFPVETTPVIVTMYFQQFIVITHAIVLVTFDFIVKEHVWFLAARFELLQNDVQLISSDEDLKFFIRKHQFLLRTSERVVNFAKYVVLKAFVLINVTVLASLIQMMNNHGPSTVIAQFFFVANIASTRVFAYCWAADTLMEKSKGVAWAIYKCQWMYQSRQARKNILFVMQRCQKPTIIMIAGLVPALTLNYCINYFYAIFSTFMALRAILGV